MTVVMVSLVLVKKQVEVAVVPVELAQMPPLHQLVVLVVMEFKLLLFLETRIIHMARELSTSVVVAEEEVDMAPHRRQHQVEMEVEVTAEQMQEIMQQQARQIPVVAVEVAHIQTHQEYMNDLEQMVDQVLLWLHTLYN
jgi:hypothetical protein